MRMMRMMTMVPCPHTPECKECAAWRRGYKTGKREGIMTGQHEYATCADYPNCAMCDAFERGYQAGKDKLAFEIRHEFGGLAMEVRREIITDYRMSHRTLADVAREAHEENEECIVNDDEPLKFY